MAGERRYTRIPPESTGDRIYMIYTAELPYDAKDTNHIWQVGGRYYLTGGVDSNNDFSIHVHGVTEVTSTTGVLSVHYEKLAKYQGYSPENNQSIRKTSSVGDIVATVNGTATDLLIPSQNIMGFDNPEYGWNIDRFGAGSVNFTEGSAQFTSYGSLRTSHQQLIAQYSFVKSSLPKQFSTTIKGASTVSHLPLYSMVEEKVGQNTNDIVTHTSNTYHPQVNGSGILFIMGNRIGDTGQDGVLRNWGSFDDTDGFMFRLGMDSDGNATTGDGTELSIVHRRTFNSIKTEGIIPQASWNKDKLDGTGSSGMNLDVTKANIYWIDFQNLGGGSIRWGVLYSGERIICHEMDMTNGGPAETWTTNAVCSPNRPICWSMKRTDGSLSDLQDRYQYPLGAAVWSESDVDIMGEGEIRSFDDTYTLTSGSDYTQGAYYLFSLRPKLSILSSDGATEQENHSLYLPVEASIFAVDGSGNDVAGEFRIFSRCIVAGENYKAVVDTEMEIEEDGSHVGHGTELYKHPVRGISKIDFSNTYNTIQNGTWKPNAEATTAFNKQSLTKVTNASGIVELTMGTNPVTNTNIHFFEDKQEVTIAGLSLSGPSDLNGNSYYTAFTGKTTTRIYDAVADITDDRLPRVLTVSSVSGGTIDVDDVLTITGGGTSTVIAVDGSSITVKGRDNAALDVGLTSASGTTDSGVTSFTVDSVALQGSAYPQDLDTVLNAVTGSGWANATEGTGSTDVGTAAGTPPASHAWTYMFTPISGALSSGENNIHVSIRWKERIQ